MQGSGHETTLGLGAFMFYSMCTHVKGSSKHMVWALYRRWRLGSQPGADVLVRIELVEESRRSGEGRNTTLLRCRCHLANVCCSLIRKVILDKNKLMHAGCLRRRQAQERRLRGRRSDRRRSRPLQNRGTLCSNHAISIW